MVRVITQETYDDVVKENIDEFDMSPEEAIKEAVAQFEAQGVDLSNIIKDLALSSNETHLICISINNLKELCNSSKDKTLILKELEIFKTECNKDIAHRVRAGKEGAYKVLIDLLDENIKTYKQENNDIIIKVLNSLAALMDVQPDLLDIKGVELTKSILESIENDEILIATLQWISVCCLKHEMNRQKLFAKNISDNLKVLLEKKENAKLLSETLQAIRRFTLDDDIRMEFGKAHEHARELGTNLLEQLTGLLRENTKPPLVSELMLTISTLLVRHELCARAYDDVLYAVLTDNYDNVAVIQQAAKL
ncbi:unnamed protein product, partial [Brenthis ino]